MFLNKIFSHKSKELKKINDTVIKVLNFEEEMIVLSNKELKLRTKKLKKKVSSNRETLDSILPEAFAICREATYRSTGLKLYPVQIMGGIALHQGKIIEMKTGEGKTLAVTFPAYLNALTGKGVHIITVNEYLAKRDKEQMEKIFKLLGLSIGLIYSGQTIKAKQEAYNCDITYGTNSEFCFDYLKDNLVYNIDKIVQRKLNFCIVDEVDSILIDESRMPLIISSDLCKPTDLYKSANDYIKTLNCHDFLYDEKSKEVWLTDSGIRKAEDFFSIINLGDLKNLEINHCIINALKANFILKKDINYVIKNHQIIIIDDFTGRLVKGKIYSHGVQQAVEVKEGLKLHPINKINGTITYQNYFRMYNKLSGMTGTATIEKEEFREIYNLDIVEIPTNKPIARLDYNDIILKTKKEKQNFTIKLIEKYHKKGQPILIGTTNIKESELLSNLLKTKDIPHNILNAKLHEKEASIIAQAGRYKAITIATNMAGRGTDILLGGNPTFLSNKDFYSKYDKNFNFIDSSKDEIDFYNCLLEKYKEETKIERKKVIRAGGLIVIGTDRHESRRIDNQLRGRSGRQGEPGNSVFVLSLEDDLLRIFGGEKVQSLANSLKLKDNTPITSQFVSKIVENSQKKIEGLNFESRKNIVQFDNVIVLHRETIYKDRYTILNSNKESLLNYVNILIKKQVNYLIGQNTIREGFDYKSINKELNNLFGTTDRKYIVSDFKLEEYLNNLLSEKFKGIKQYNNIEIVLKKKMLKIIDNLWKEHIENLNELKQGSFLQVYANKNPRQMFKIESYNLFEILIKNIIFMSLKEIFSLENI